MNPGLRKISLLSVVTLTLLWGHAVAAQRLDDFKGAVGKDGCNSIPYSDLQRKTCAKICCNPMTRVGIYPQILKKSSKGNMHKSYA